MPKDTSHAEMSVSSRSDVHTVQNPLTAGSGALGKSMGLQKLQHATHTIQENRSSSMGMSDDLVDHKLNAGNAKENRKLKQEARAEAMKQRGNMKNRQIVNRTKLWNLEVEKHSCMQIHPDGNFEAVWSIIQAVILIWIILEVPFRATFQVPGMEILNLSIDGVRRTSLVDIVDAVMDGFMFLDMSTRFFVSFYDGVDGDLTKAHALNTNYCDIASRYVTGMFIFDFASCMPIDTYFRFTGRRDLATKLRLLRLLHMSRVTDATRLCHVMLSKATASMHGLKRFEGLVYVIIYFLLGNHFLSCVLFWVGHPPRECCNDEHCTSLLNRTDWPVEGCGWLAEESLWDLCGSHPYHVYFIAYHFSLGMLFGESFPCSTPFEHVYNAGMFLVGGFTYAVLIGRVVGFLEGMQISQVQYDARVAEIEEFFQHTAVSKELRQRVYMYFEAAFPNSKIYEPKRIMTYLPECMRIDLQREIYGHIIMNVPFIPEENENIVTEVCSCLVPLAALPGETIIRENSTGKAIYIVVHGEVEWTTGFGESSGKYRRGDYFGDVGVLFNMRERQTVVAAQFTDLCKLDKADIMRISKQYPELKTSMVLFAQETLHKIERAQKGEAEVGKGGWLNVGVHCAENIIAADGISGSDPYCVLTLEEVVTTNDYNRTRYLNNTQNPSWDETFTVFVENLHAAKLYLHIFDYDRYDKDDFLGEVCVHLQDVPTEPEERKWYDLADCSQLEKGKKTHKLPHKTPASGRLCLTLEWDHSGTNEEGSQDLDDDHVSTKDNTGKPKKGMTDSLGHHTLDMAKLTDFVKYREEVVDDGDDMLVLERKIERKLEGMSAHVDHVEAMMTDLVGTAHSDASGDRKAMRHELHLEEQALATRELARMQSLLTTQQTRTQAAEARMQAALDELERVKTQLNITNSPAKSSQGRDQWQQPQTRSAAPAATADPEIVPLTPRSAADLGATPTSEPTRMV